LSSIRQIGVLSLLFATAVLSGCASIHSDAVRELITYQTEKTHQASKAATMFVEHTKDSVAATKKATKDLNSALQMLRTEESKYALVFASPQFVTAKTGIDAEAFAYRVGVLYLDTQAGLDQAVQKQFEEDLRTMERLAMDIDESWKSLSKAQEELSSYSQRSGLAATDPALLRAVLEEAQVKPELVDDVIQRSKQVNKALAKASGSIAVARTDEAVTARGFFQDLIQMLESARMP